MGEGRVKAGWVGVRWRGHGRGLRLGDVWKLSCRWLPCALLRALGSGRAVRAEAFLMRGRVLQKEAPCPLHGRRAPVVHPHDERQRKHLQVRSFWW